MACLVHIIPRPQSRNCKNIFSNSESWSSILGNLEKEQALLLVSGDVATRLQELTGTLWVLKSSPSRFPVASQTHVNLSWPLRRSQYLPPTRLPFSIMLPSCGCPLPRGRGSATLAAIWPPPSLPTISCPGMIMSGFRTPCFWSTRWGRRDGSEGRGERERGETCVTWA